MQSKHGIINRAGKGTLVGRKREALREPKKKRKRMYRNCLFTFFEWKDLGDQK
jgi:hypothetical protein